MNQNNKRGLYIYLAILMAVVFLAMSWFNSTAAKKEVEYNQIVAEFLTDQVGEYQLDFNTRTLTYTLWSDMDQQAGEPGAEDNSSGSSQAPASPLFPGAQGGSSSSSSRGERSRCRITACSSRTCTSTAWITTPSTRISR